jgi:serine protease Do
MKIRHFLFVIVLSVFSAYATFLVLNKNQKLVYYSTSLNSGMNPVQAKNVTFSSAGLTNFIDAAAVSTPAVVHVKTSYEVNTSDTREFYGDQVYDWFFGNKRSNQGPQKKQSIASGSGVIFSEDGYIVTNNHVIENAKSIEVTLSNNKKYKAVLVGADKDTDLAVLKIEEENLPNLNFANSDDVRVGEWVLAVGNPFDLSSTVTAGIVSAKGRNINILESHSRNSRSNTAIESFIQTDAAVNSGNSGGALVNTRGELIGINTAIATPTGIFAGYSFAVPSNLVSKVVTDIKNFGAAQRAYLGVNITHITNEMAHELKLKDLDGIYVANVLKNSAANEAGLRIGDVIVSVADEKIKSTAELQEKIAEYRPLDKVDLILIRDGEEKFLEITLQ